MQTVVLTIIVLGVIVFIHELGHFLTAKWAGVGVPRFSIGLGPRVVGFQVGETDYCLSAIPFGGYVKMTGMEGEEAFEGLEGGAAEADGDPDASVPPEHRFDNQPARWRLLILSAGVLMNFLSGWIIYVGLAWFGGVSTIPGTEIAAVDEAAIARHPELEGLAGSTIATIDGRPVANWFEIDDVVTEGQGSPVVFELADGRSIDVPVTGAESRKELIAGIQPLVPPTIATVDPGGPADGGGIESGDRIVSVDGVPTASFSDVSEAITTRPDRVIPVEVRRETPEGARQLTLTIHTGVTKAPRPTDGKFVDVGMLGVGAAVDRISLGPVESLVTGTTATLNASTLILDGLYQLVTGGVSMRSLGGPVAIGQLTGHFARQGIDSLLGWVALFSINLAILNLLPIPVLDGGHILFLGIEATRGRPLSPHQKLRLSQVGLVFLGLLMAWAFTADILRLVGF